GDGPADDEHRLDIKDDEQHGDEIELRGETKACGSSTHDTAFVRLFCCPLLMPLSQDIGESEHQYHKAEHNAAIGNDGPKQVGFVRTFHNGLPPANVFVLKGPSACYANGRLQYDQWVMYC